MKNCRQISLFLFLPGDVAKVRFPEFQFTRTLSYNPRLLVGAVRLARCIMGQCVFFAKSSSSRSPGPCCRRTTSPVVSATRVVFPAWLYSRSIEVTLPSSPTPSREAGTARASPPATSTNGKVEHIRCVRFEANINRCAGKTGRIYKNELRVALNRVWRR